MNQFITLNQKISQGTKKQDFGYFQVSRMPKSVEERELEEDRAAFARMKAQSEPAVTPIIKRRRRRVEGVE